MPSLTSFDNSGQATNATNVTAGASTTTQYVLVNHTGSTMTLHVNSGTSLTVNVVRSAGHISDAVANEGNFVVGADESVILRVVNTGTAAPWRIGQANTHHGLAAKPGTGHTGLSDEQPLGVYYGTI